MVISIHYFETIVKMSKKKQSRFDKVRHLQELPNGFLHPDNRKSLSEVQTRGYTIITGKPTSSDQVLRQAKEELKSHSEVVQVFSNFKVAKNRRPQTVSDDKRQMVVSQPLETTITQKVIGPDGNLVDKKVRDLSEYAGRCD
jgi:tRNA G37 N-methylase Trm5